MNTYELTLGLMGLVLIGATWLPHLLKQRVLSFPIVYVALGFLLYQLPLPFPDPDPIRLGSQTEHLTELVVLIALVSAGLRIDTPIGWKRWNPAWRLLGIAMPLCILAGAALGYWLMGLGLASACLIGAVLAPTDPVLASDVQVGPPGQGKEDPVRIALTTEAGLNDGLAFPFVWFAIAMAGATAGDFEWVARWAWLDLLYRIVAGVAIGWGLGYLLMYLIFRVESSTRISQTEDGLAALGITLLVYGVTEVVGGYGFLAVFVAALAIRHYERSHKFHDTLTLFAEQCERLLMTAVLLLFGGALAHGVLDDLGWEGMVFGLGFVLLVRPLAGTLSMVGSSLPWRERLAVSGFGVRGIGSIYYLAFALGQASFPMHRQLWATVCYVVLLSILVHGLAATSIMQYLDSRRRTLRRETQAGSGTVDSSGSG
jgi:NhaP-type Na+/H+ or K+/H+ antiporter